MGSFKVRANRRPNGHEFIQFLVVHSSCRTPLGPKTRVLVSHISSRKLHGPNRWEVGGEGTGTGTDTGTYRLSAEGWVERCGWQATDNGHWRVTGGITTGTWFSLTFLTVVPITIQIVENK